MQQKYISAEIFPYLLFSSEPILNNSLGILVTDEIKTIKLFQWNQLWMSAAKQTLLNHQFHETQTDRLCCTKWEHASTSSGLLHWKPNCFKAAKQKHGRIILRPSHGSQIFWNQYVPFLVVRRSPTKTLLVFSNCRCSTKYKKST